MKKPVAKAKAREARKIPTPQKPPKGWTVCGFDTSMSSLSGAAIAFDAITNKLKGPVFTQVRWNSTDDYYQRLKAAAGSYDLVLDLQHQLNVVMNTDEIFIAQEEPWPYGMTAGKTSGFLKQQAEISGAFLSGLIRWGYPNIMQMNSMRWRTMIAEELGITTHFTKWRDPELALKYNCRPNDSGKFRAKQWALNPGYAFQGTFTHEVPDLPDIIERKGGKTPRPEGSTAKAVQPDDIYDALAIAWTFFLELQETGMLKSGTSS